MRHKGFWRETITQAVMALEGQDSGEDCGVDSSDIYQWIRLHAEPELTEHELSESPHQGRPYFHNTVRGIANDMCDEGRLFKVRPARAGANSRFRLP